MRRRRHVRLLQTGAPAGQRVSIVQVQPGDQVVTRAREPNMAMSPVYGILHARDQAKPVQLIHQETRGRTSDTQQMSQFTDMYGFQIGRDQQPFELSDREVQFQPRSVSGPAQAARKMLIGIQCFF